MHWLVGLASESATRPAHGDSGPKHNWASSIIDCRLGSLERDATDSDSASDLDCFEADSLAACGSCEGYSQV